jgi:hypothetical protein
MHGREQLPGGGLQAGPADIEHECGATLLRAQVAREGHGGITEWRRQLEPGIADRNPLGQRQRRQPKRLIRRCRRPLEAAQAQPTLVERAAQHQAVHGHLLDLAAQQQAWAIANAQPCHPMIRRIADPHPGQLERVQADPQIIEFDLALAREAQDGAERRGGSPDQHRAGEREYHEDRQAGTQRPTPSPGSRARGTHHLVRQWSNTTICCDVNLTVWTRQT